MQFTNMYSIYDKAAGAYLPPFFMANDALAMRAFSTLVNDPGHLFHAEPSDFLLYRHGSFDQSLGTMETQDEPKKIATGLSCIKLRATDGQLEMLKEA